MNSSRAICSRCDFILARCLCDYLNPIDNLTELIILQHPTETNHALNTVRLMKNSFSHIKIFIGENFDQHPDLKKIINDGEVALIFPNEKKQSINSKNAERISRLIFIDGSWSKARKIYFASTILHTIPTYELELQERSKYRIRSSSLEQSLSTLEAATLILKTIEPQLDTSGLENAFKRMIDFQIEKMGPETFDKNYKKKGDE